MEQLAVECPITFPDGRVLDVRKYYIDICINKLYELEGLYDRLTNLVIDPHGLYTLMEYEEILKDIYPKELLNKYENTVKDMATNTLGRAHYREIVSILRRMKKYSEGKEKVSGIVCEWKSKYRNRPAMMDELGRL